jgi:PhoH-like ATPase
VAGRGTSLSAIAAAVQSVFDGEYEKIIYSRIMSQSGHYDIGTLPGDLQERYDPYLQAFHCNAELLQESKRKFIDSLLKENRLEFIPAQLFRGASFARSYIIMDEVQTLTHKEMLTIGTRVGPGSKIVFCGDLNQRDEDIARYDTGFWAAINREGMKNSPLVSVIELVKSERGKVSALFSEVFNDID